MKPFTVLSALVLGVVMLTQPLQSQTPRSPKSALQQLQEMKAANAKLLEQQTATLQKLDDTVKEAAQLRILVRRT